MTGMIDFPSTGLKTLVIWPYRRVSAVGLPGANWKGYKDIEVKEDKKVKIKIITF